MPAHSNRVPPKIRARLPAFPPFRPVPPLIEHETYEAKPVVSLRRTIKYPSESKTLNKTIPFLDAALRCLETLIEKNDTASGMAVFAWCVYRDSRMSKSMRDFAKESIGESKKLLRKSLDKQKRDHEDSKRNFATVKDRYLQKFIKHRDKIRKRGKEGAGEEKDAASTERRMVDELVEILEREIENYERTREFHHFYRFQTWPNSTHSHWDFRWRLLQEIDDAFSRGENAPQLVVGTTSNGKTTQNNRTTSQHQSSAKKKSRRREVVVIGPYSPKRSRASYALTGVKPIKAHGSKSKRFTDDDFVPSSFYTQFLPTQGASSNPLDLWDLTVGEPSEVSYLSQRIQKGGIIAIAIPEQADRTETDRLTRQYVTAARRVMKPDARLEVVVVRSDDTVQDVQTKLREVFDEKDR